VWGSSHWKELMEKTGQTFDMNAETFTLENIFAMELHRFQDKIGEIVNCAIKELAIEKVCYRRVSNFSEPTFEFPNLTLNLYTKTDPNANWSNRLSIAVYGKSVAKLRSVTCHMGLHTVTRHPIQVNAPHLNPSHTGRYSIYLPRRDERLS